MLLVPTSATFRGGSAVIVPSENTAVNPGHSGNVFLVKQTSTFYYLGPRKERSGIHNSGEESPLHEACDPGTDKYSGFYTVTCLPKHSARVPGSLKSHT